jgi:hypothetical protein
LRFNVDGAMNWVVPLHTSLYIYSEGLFIFLVRGGMQCIVIFCKGK